MTWHDRWTRLYSKCLLITIVKIKISFDHFLSNQKFVGFRPSTHYIYTYETWISVPVRVRLFVHVFQTHQKSQYYGIWDPGVIWANIKHDEARFFIFFYFTDSIGIFCVFFLFILVFIIFVHQFFHIDFRFRWFL